MENIFQQITEEQYNFLSTLVDKHYNKNTIDFLKNAKTSFLSSDVAEVFGTDATDRVLELGTFIDDILCKEKYYECEIISSDHKSYDDNATDEDIRTFYRKDDNYKLSPDEIQSYFDEQLTYTDWNAIDSNHHEVDTSSYYERTKYFLFGWDYFADKYSLREVA